MFSCVFTLPKDTCGSGCFPHGSGHLTALSRDAGRAGDQHDIEAHAQLRGKGTPSFPQQAFYAAADDRPAEFWGDSQTCAVFFASVAAHIKHDVTGRSGPAFAVKASELIILLQGVFQNGSPFHVRKISAGKSTLPECPSGKAANIPAIRRGKNFFIHGTNPRIFTPGGDFE